MPARYRIEHRSRYDYDRSVAASFNEARLTPSQTPWQVRLESSIAIDPMSWNYRYTDYWGTEVRVFEASSAHRTLEVRAVSLVEVNAMHRPAPLLDADWELLRAAAVRDEHVEYLAQTPLTEPPPELAERAEALAAAHPPAHTAALLGEAVHEALAYMTGVTEVQTTAAEAWQAGSGVCQDYAHLLVGALRHVGVPARYVSGYLYPWDDAALGDTAVGESHAWVEWWLGDWAATDPTSLAEVAERHVTVGAGRDYGDVPPIKGIVAGGHNAVALTVTVELTRLA